MTQFAFRESHGDREAGSAVVFKESDDKRGVGLRARPFRLDNVPGVLERETSSDHNYENDRDRPRSALNAVHQRVAGIRHVKSKTFIEGVPEPTATLRRDTQYTRSEGSGHNVADPQPREHFGRTIAQIRLREPNFADVRRTDLQDASIVEFHRQAVLETRHNHASPAIVLASLKTVQFDN